MHGLVRSHQRSLSSAIPEGALMIVLIVFTVSIIDVCILSTPAHVLGQAFFQNTILNSYGSLIKSLLLTLAERSYYAGVEQGARIQCHRVLVTLRSPTLATHLHLVRINQSKAPSSRSDGVDDRATERPQTPSFTDKSRAISPLPTSPPMESKGPTDFCHPATVEEQRMIWLPKDPFGRSDTRYRAGSYLPKGSIFYGGC